MMLTTAAGTIAPAKVLVLGAGVAGLQAIATARRLGAVVPAYDVRMEAAEQIASLGARPVADERTRRWPAPTSRWCWTPTTWSTRRHVTTSAAPIFGMYFGDAGKAVSEMTTAMAAV